MPPRTVYFADFAIAIENPLVTCQDHRWTLSASSALATADLGIVGTDVAIETADVALMGEDLRHLTHAHAPPGASCCKCRPVPRD